MLRIVYMSRARANFSSEDFASLAARSARNNRDEDLTGLLLFDGSRFLQAIEGDPARVDACFARISADPRHRDIVLVRRDHIADREFGSWSLRGRDAVGEAEQFSGEVRDDVRGVSDHGLAATFIGFAALAG